MNNSLKDKSTKSEDHAYCEKCHGTGQITRSVPIGEALVVMETVFKKLSEMINDYDGKSDFVLSKKNIVFPKNNACVLLCNFDDVVIGG